MQVTNRGSNKLYFFLVVVVIGNLFFSCQNEDCVSIYNNYLLVEFVQADTLESGKIEYSALDTVFYSVTAVGNETVFYDKNDWESKLVLPVNPASDLTEFRLEMIDSIRYDTLSLDPIVLDTIYYVNPTPHIISIIYERRQKIITEDCGVEIAFVNLEIEEITFPISNLLEDQLTRFNESNIEVLF